jgi:hypothetical protein
MLEEKIEKSSGLLNRFGSAMRQNTMAYVVSSIIALGTTACDSDDNRSECCKSYSSCVNTEIDTCTKIYRECYDDASASHCITDSDGNKSCCGCDEGGGSDTCK